MMTASDSKVAIQRNARFSEPRLAVIMLVASALSFVFFAVLFSGVSKGEGWGWTVYPNAGDVDSVEDSCSCAHVAKILTNVGLVLGRFDSCFS